MSREKLHIWAGRIYAFLWGYIFIILFQYVLNNIHPFIQNNTGISVVAHVLIFAGWLAYLLYGKLQNHFKLQIGIRIIYLVNFLLFLYFILSNGEKKYIYWYPLLFSFQIILIYILFTAKIAEIIFYRLSILLGMIIALYFRNTIENQLIVISCTIPVIFIPKSFMGKGTIRLKRSVSVFSSLRETIDISRYLLLNLSIFTIFDQNRENFFPVLMLLIAGPVFQKLIHKVDYKKHHIKHGLIMLPVILTFLAAGLYLFPFYYVAAVGFSGLTIWETLYLKKVIEGDLNREKLLILVTIGLFLFFYGITFDWVLLIFITIVILSQFRLLFNIVKRFSYVIAMFFSAGIISWGLLFYFKYTNSYKREFFKPVQSGFIYDSDSLRPLILVGKNKTLVTNLYPEKVISQFSEKYPEVVEFTWSIAIFIPAVMEYHNSLHSDSDIYLFQEEKMGPYLSSVGKPLLDLFITEKINKPVFFYSDKDPGHYYTIYSTENIPTFEKLSADKSEMIYHFGEILSEWFISEKRNEEAYNVYKEMLQLKPSVELVENISKVCAMLGLVEDQKEYLMWLIDQNSDIVQNYKILMEILFYNGEIKESEEVARKLVEIDSDNGILYYDWIFKINEKEYNKFKWESLYRTVKRFPLEKTHKHYLKKDELLLRIANMIKANPLGYEIYEKERSRQIKIELPK